MTKREEKLCTRCGRPNGRGGRTRVCAPCHEAAPHKAVRLASPPDRKVCAYCREEKPAEEFYKNAGRADWLSTYCRVCHSGRAKHYHESDAARAKDRRLWARYNISLAEYDAMLEAQGYTCALCPKKHTHAKPLHVDHSHENPNIVRGLLCITCNQRKLGALTLAEVEAIHAYLLKPPATDVVGERLVPIGKEKGARPRRRRRYKQYGRGA